MVEFDKVLEEMGEISRSQWIHLILLYIPCILVATHMGSMVYLGHFVDFRCKYFNEKQLIEVSKELYLI